MAGKVPPIEYDCSACHRSYVGQWEILNDRLYLVGISGKLANGAKLTLATIFPGFPSRVFAHWFSGSLAVNRGKFLATVHMFVPVYECTLELCFEKGILVNSLVHHNQLTEEEKKSPWTWLNHEDE